MTEQQLRDAFHQFARNFRWGTCTDCPVSTEWNKYPEFCRNTDRQDHNLSLPALYDQYIKCWCANEDKQS